MDLGTANGGDLDALRDVYRRSSLSNVADGVVELEDLFVDPETMRRGIGRALVTEAATRARTVGGVRIEVTANPDARAFCESVGFVDIGAAATRFGLAPRMWLEIREGASDRP